MNRGKSFLDKHFDFILVDITCLIVAYIFAAFSTGKEFNSTLLASAFIALFADLVSIFLVEPYRNVLRQDRQQRAIKTVTSSVVAWAMTATVFYFFNFYSTHFDRMLATTFFTHAIFTYLWTLYLIQVVTDKQNQLKKYAICEKKHLNRVDKENLSGICVIDSKMSGIEHNGIKIDANKDELYERLKEEWIDIAFLYVNDLEKYADLISELNKMGIIVKIKLPKVIGRYETEKDMLVSSYLIASNRYLFVKRVFDIFCGLIGLLVLIPLSLIIKLINLKNGDKASIFYTQKRIGQNFKEINIIKYRSMVPDAEEQLKELLKDPKYKEEWDKNQKFENDPRITKIGKFLRKTSLDELPQLINVLKGDMSLIGPRPLVPEELDSHNGFRMYCVMRPGITGWWGCNGRSDVSYEERLKLEYYYIRNCSISLDIKIIFMTIFSILAKKGAK